MDVDQRVALHIDVQHGRVVAEGKGIRRQQHGLGPAGKVENAVGMVPVQRLQRLPDALHPAVPGPVKIRLDVWQPALEGHQRGLDLRLVPSRVNDEDQRLGQKRKRAQYIVDGVVGKKFYQGGDLLFHASSSFIPPLPAGFIPGAVPGLLPPGLPPPAVPPRPAGFPPRPGRWPGPDAPCGSGRRWG